MKKRILSLLLILCLCLTLLPVAALADDAAAAGERANGENLTTISVSTQEQLVGAFQKVKGDGSEHEWTICLTDNIVLAGGSTLSKALLVPAGKTVTLLGGGHTITYNSDTTSATDSLKLGVKGGTLNLGAQNGTDTLTITTNNQYDHANQLIGVFGGTVNMYRGVTLTGNINTSSGAGGVEIHDGTFNMYGGTISHCTSRFGSGGGVQIAYDAYDVYNPAFHMYDGIIEYNTAENDYNYEAYGGGVAVWSGSFTMHGGTIQNNVAGGDISTGNKFYGGGVYCYGADVTIAGGTICGNQAGPDLDNATQKFGESYGGGICIYNSAATMNDCSITKNRAQYGGGAAVLSGSSFEASAPGNVICNNTADTAAADVFATTGVTSIQLPDASGMDAVYAADRAGKKIDGWYPDPAEQRYNPSKDATPADVSGLPAAAWYLVASYKLGEDSGGSGGDDPSTTYYYFALEKIDAQDGHTLSGARFGLYLDGKQIAIATSDRNGIAMLQIPGSRYRAITDSSDLYYQELTAPEGYVVDSDKVSIEKSDLTTDKDKARENAETVYNLRSSTPGLLNGDDHFAYVIGYQDGTVRPDAPITRAETAAIFFRLLKDEVRDGNLTSENSFEDVTDELWYNKPVSTMAALGIVKGRSSTAFDPNASITRAEFAAICARFDTGRSSGTQTFSDIAGHWAQSCIERAAELGWIRGFADGTFHPDACITRAQAMTMINRVLNRIPEDASDLLPDMNVWPDCNPGDWFYLAVQEATNSHNYKHKAGNYETWTSMKQDPDWTRYET